jgi:hypothetical protein
LKEFPVKKMLVALVALNLAAVASATEFKTRLMDVGAVLQGDTQIPVMAEAEGRVLWVDARDTDLISALRMAQKEGRTVRVDFNEADGFLNGVELLAQEVEAATATPAADEKDNFMPSVLDFATADSVFDAMDGRTKWKSQCFNRAHGWAYDMNRRFGINSMKMFIFFTSRHIREYKYKWWFHVAPYVLVAQDNMSVEHVMDVSFSRGPTTTRNWTNYFMEGDWECKSVQRYSEYRQNQESQHCYLIRANMFYRSPRDLEQLETEGRQELGWNLDEVREARKQAFKNWRNYNP